jgi:mannose-6-phosphate isomerase-like protein (cupin superfamily)
MSIDCLSVRGEGFEVVCFGGIAPADCPCGNSKRAFVRDDGSPSLHKVINDGEDRPHRHKTVEIYYVLECGPNAAMILDGKHCPVAPGVAVRIESDVLHGMDNGGERMKVLVYVATGHGSPEAQMSFEE